MRKGLRPSYSFKQKCSFMFISMRAVSALLNIENGARLLPGESFYPLMVGGRAYLRNLSLPSPLLTLKWPFTYAIFRRVASA